MPAKSYQKMGGGVSPSKGGYHNLGKLESFTSPKGGNWGPNREAIEKEPERYVDPRHKKVIVNTKCSSCQ